MQQLSLFSFWQRHIYFLDNLTIAELSGIRTYTTCAVQMLTCI